MNRINRWMVVTNGVLFLVLACVVVAKWARLSAAAGTAAFRIWIPRGGEFGTWVLYSIVFLMEEKLRKRIRGNKIKMYYCR